MTLLNFLLIDSILLLLIVGLLAYHVRQSRRERHKTEEIRQDLEQEREKTKKFHIDVEHIRKLTKG